MSRLQKKCFISASAVHGLLLVILFFGAALMPSPEEKPMKLITVYSPEKISELLETSGGNPNVTAAPPNQAGAPTEKPAVAEPPKAIEVPKPLPEVVKPAPKPEPVVKPVEIPKPVARIIPPKLTPSRIPLLDKTKPVETKRKPQDDPEIATASAKQKHKVVIDPDSLKAVKRTENDAESRKEAQEAADRAERAEANARRRQIQGEIAQITHTIGHGLSASTVVEMPGPGGGGQVTANYRDIIASKYYNAWSAPAELDDATPVVTARITISREGNVISAKIIKRSGNAMMDRSIQNVLETVTFIEAFPGSSSDQEKTVTVQFNVRAKRQIG